MRSLRALLHLVLALAVLAAGVAQTRAIAAPAMMRPAHGHAVPATAPSGRAMHEHGTASGDHPVHQRDACQTACCFAPAQLSARVADASPVAFRAVRYPDLASALWSLRPAPEPGIPKHAA